MKRCSQKTAAFSLVEVTLALGVAGFCLIAVFGLLPVGAQINQRAISQTAATAILSDVIVAIRPNLYDGSKTYFSGNIVTYKGSLYVAIATTTGNLPTNTSYWSISITSPPYGITFGTSKTLYFDGGGACSTDINGTTKPDGSSWTTPLLVRYRLDVTFPWTSGLTYGADLKVTWPAAADPTNASRSSEMFAAFDRR
jgi:hypothetical protein